MRELQWRLPCKLHDGRAQCQPWRMCPDMPSALHTIRCARTHARGVEASAIAPRPQPLRFYPGHGRCRRHLIQDRGTTQGGRVCEKHRGMVFPYPRPRGGAERRPICAPVVRQVKTRIQPITRQIVQPRLHHLFPVRTCAGQGAGIARHPQSYRSARGQGHSL